MENTQKTWKDCKSIEDYKGWAKAHPWKTAGIIFGSLWVLGTIVGGDNDSPKNTLSINSKEYQDEVTQYHSVCNAFNRYDPRSEECLRLFAKRGNSYAQYFLGLRLATGMYSVTKDREEAIKWLKKAARNGQPNAQKTLEQVENGTL
jgi:hypothetical protein